jgi:SET domain-containing protein
MSAFVVRHSPIHGTGVFAARDIPAHEEIIEYAGRRITQAQADAEYPNDDGHTFLYVLNDHWLIDAGVDGNDARWINHGCDPNCEVWLVESDDGDPAKDRLVIESLRAIKAGEELTYDYGVVTDGPVTDEDRALWRCRCGSPKCKGTMLEEASEVSSRA